MRSLANYLKNNISNTVLTSERRIQKNDFNREYTRAVAKNELASLGEGVEVEGFKTYVFEIIKDAVMWMFFSMKTNNIGIKKTVVNFSMFFIYIFHDRFHFLF